MARIHIVVPDRLHRQAKVAAAYNDQTLKDWIISAIEARLQNNPPPTRGRTR